MKKPVISKAIFLTQLNLYREFDKTEQELHKLNIDVVESTFCNCFFKLFESNMKCFFNDENYDAIIDYLCSTTKYTKKNPYIFESKTKKPLVWDDETLCEFLKLK